MKIDYKKTYSTRIHIHMYKCIWRWVKIQWINNTCTHLPCPMNELPFSLCIYSYGNCKSHWAFDKFKLTVWFRSIVSPPPPPTTTILMKYRTKVTREDVELVSQCLLHLILWSTIYFLFFYNFYQAAWW